MRRPTMERLQIMYDETATLVNGLPYFSRGLGAPDPLRSR